MNPEYLKALEELVIGAKLMMRTHELICEPSDCQIAGIDLIREALKHIEKVNLKRPKHIHCSCVHNSLEEKE